VRAVVALAVGVAGVLVTSGRSLPRSAAAPDRVPDLSATAAPGPGELLRVDFSAAPLGTFDVDTARAVFGNAHGTVGVQRLDPLDAVLAEGGNRFFRKTFPAGTCCFQAHATSFNWRLHRPHEELYLSYRVRFRPGFDGRKGGKLPGFCGGTCNTDGRVATGTGWSARGMWREDPVAGGVDNLVQYVYHLDQPDRYGDHLFYRAPDGGSVLRPSTWQWVEHRVVMNTPGRAEGVAQAWVDGVLVLDRSDLRYRSSADVGIDRLLFHLFFGGDDPTWAPVRDEWIDIDDVVVSTRRVVKV